MENFKLEINGETILNELNYSIKNGDTFFGLLPIEEMSIIDIDIDYINELEGVLAFNLMDYFKDALYRYLDKEKCVEKEILNWA